MRQETLYPIVYDQKHYAVMANDVIKGKQEMTLQEARILRLVITQVAKEDKDLKTYTCNIKDLAVFLQISDANLYRDIRDICKGLLKRTVDITTGNPREPWESFQWVQLARYDGNGSITLMLSEQIKPYVLELDRYFTRYQLENILEMNSFYAIRLYELLKCDDFKEHEEFREYTVKFLREFFSCEEKYKLFSDFKRWVLNIAVREINEKSDLEIRDVSYIKSGRKVIGIRFLVWDNYDVVKKRSARIPGQMKIGKSSGL